MKKVLLVLSVLLIFMTGCSDDNSNFHKSKKTVTVEVNKMNEALAVTQYLGDQFIVNKLDMAYKDRIDEYFKDYDTEDIIRQLRIFSKKGFGYDAPVQYVLSMNNDKITLSDEEYEQLESRVPIRDSNESFERMINEFMEITNFDAFYESEQPYYEEIINKFWDNNDVVKISEIHKDYFGYGQKSYTIVLSPLIQGNFGLRFNEEDLNFDSYMIVCPNHRTDHFGDMYGTLLHELNHSYVNPLTEDYIDEVNEHIAYYEAHESELPEYYRWWDVALDEYIVRAIHCRMLLMSEGEEAYQEQLKTEKDMGFLEVEKLCEYLKAFEENKKEYGTFKAFYPELLEFFVVEEAVD